MSWMSRLAATHKISFEGLMVSHLHPGKDALLCEVKNQIRPIWGRESVRDNENPRQVCFHIHLLTNAPS